ncbi:hypothetical protein [Phycicoccus flavus]|uniref:hypothetical protein n=1 Tax=Phycicoccus flavus TaxID=2502783 RepID=UPI000FEB9A21|nr:hypothetical protein [Phycicoccus flavus]NHA70074.1 hypothetical protein [Phycicoccus flavus]
MSDPAVQSGGDGRSVGELLLNADIHARSALWDVDAEHAKPRLRTWGEVIEAAAHAWATIPDPARDPAMQQIHARASHRNPHWPGGGDGDPLLEEVAVSLSRVAELVGGRRHPTAPLSDAGELDAAAARTRLMHTLYVASHATALALTHHVRELEGLRSRGRTTSRGESVTHARAARDRATTVERIAGHYLVGSWPTALDGQHRDSPEVRRLSHAVARWDVQAHRTLARAPTTADIETVVQVQVELAIATSVIASAARPDMTSSSRRFSPMTAETQREWGALGANLRQLLGRDRQRERKLLLAAGELRAALHEITHDGAGLAAPAVIAARTSPERTLRELQRSTAAATDIANAVREALQEPGLVVAPLGAHDLAVAHLGADVEVPWVDPADLATGRRIALPESVRTLLLEQSERIVATTRRADSALGSPRSSTDSADRATGERQALSGRRHDDRLPSPARGVMPSFGCER